MLRLLTIFFFLLLLFFAALHSSAQNKLTVSIDPSSKLKILGSSNVNTFTCQQSNSITDQAIRVEVEEYKTGWIVNNAELILDVDSFDCGMKQMTEDFKQTLRSNDYPYLKLQIHQVSKGISDSTYLANVSILLAGKSQDYLIPVSVDKASNSFICSGHRRVKFRDFNLKPPEKFFGMIRVDEEIDIVFELILQLANKDHY